MQGLLEGFRGADGFQVLGQPTLQADQVLFARHDLQQRVFLLFEFLDLLPDCERGFRQLVLPGRGLFGKHRDQFAHLLLMLGLADREMLLHVLADLLECFREAVANLDHFSAHSRQEYIFAGFNALNAAEEAIVEHLLALDRAKVYWDSDSAFLDDMHHDAGLFLRRFKKNWKHYKNHPFEWIADDFRTSKKIDVIGTPKSIGQAKIAGDIVRQIVDRDQTLSKTAIVLAEENLLLPLLYSLPANTGPLNITMGYPTLSNSPEATKVAVDALTQMLGSENVKVAEQVMGAEDFAYMFQQAPGCYIHLGVHDPAWGDKVYRVHRADFRIDEDALPVGSAALAAAALNWMKEKR